MKYRSDRLPHESGVREIIHREFWLRHGASVVRHYSTSIMRLMNSWKNQLWQISLLQTSPDRIDKFYKGDV